MVCDKIILASGQPILETLSNADDAIVRAKGSPNPISSEAEITNLLPIISGFIPVSINLASQ